MFSPDVMSILEAGTSLIVGTVGADGEPRATRAYALTIADSEAKVVRAVVGADDPVTVEHLQTGRIAVTAADVRTLRSVQLKGRITRVEAPTEHDLRMADEHSGLFLDAISQTDGMEIDLTRRMLAIEMISVEFIVEQLFDQTPGPGAGSPVSWAR